MSTNKTLNPVASALLRVVLEQRTPLTTEQIVENLRQDSLIVLSRSDLATDTCILCGRSIAQAITRPSGGDCDILGLVIDEIRARVRALSQGKHYTMGHELRESVMNTFCEEIPDTHLWLGRVQTMLLINDLKPVEGKVFDYVRANSPSVRYRYLLEDLCGDDKARRSAVGRAAHSLVKKGLLAARIEGDYKQWHRELASRAQIRLLRLSAAFSVP